VDRGGDQAAGLDKSLECRCFAWAFFRSTGDMELHHAVGSSDREWHTRSFVGRFVGHGSELMDREGMHGRVPPGRAALRSKLRHPIPRALATYPAHRGGCAAPQRNKRVRRRLGTGYQGRP